MKASEILNEQESTASRPSIGTDQYLGRRPRLTIRMLHRLRQMQELKKFEDAEKRKFVSDMYGGNFEESDEKPKDSKNPPQSLKPLKPSKPSKPSSKYLDKYTRS